MIFPSGVHPSKRLFDLAISLAGLILLSPFLLLITTLVWVKNGRPMLYKQQRPGYKGKPFFIYKFRTMTDKRDPVGNLLPDSERLTDFGRFLRSTSLDELPQLFNILRGDMSLVGPRPERPHFVQQFRYLVPKYSERHRVRSGITGWAQVNGLRGQSPVEERTKYDIYYIENWSLWFDLKIIILTFMAILKGENAY